MTDVAGDAYPTAARTTARTVSVIAEYAFTVTGERPAKSPLIDHPHFDKSRQRRIRRYAIRKPIALYLILSVSGLLIVLFVHWLLNFGIVINGTVYVATVGVLIAAYQAWLLSLNRQAEYIEDYFSKLFQKEQYFEAWYDLFQTYRMETFNTIDARVSDGTASSMADLTDLNADRTPGRRFWHPKLLLGSPEEPRVDSLLGYLNLLGDYYERGNLELEEIGDAAAYYLFAVGNSKVFEAYLSVIRAAFRGEDKDGNLINKQEFTAYRMKFGSPPYRHLCLLLNDLNEQRKFKDIEVYARFNHIRGD